jgi:hypothetical protein
MSEEGLALDWGEVLEGGIGRAGIDRAVEIEMLYGTLQGSGCNPDNSMRENGYHG